MFLGKNSPDRFYSTSIICLHILWTFWMAGHYFEKEAVRVILNTEIVLPRIFKGLHNPIYLPTYLQVYLPTGLTSYRSTYLFTYRSMYKVSKGAKIRNRYTWPRIPMGKWQTHSRHHKRDKPMYLYLPTYLYIYLRTFMSTYLPTGISTFLHANLPAYMQV